MEPTKFHATQSERRTSSPSLSFKGLTETARLPSLCPARTTHWADPLIADAKDLDLFPQRGALKSILEDPCHVRHGEALESGLAAETTRAEGEEPDPHNTTPPLDANSAHTHNHLPIIGILDDDSVTTDADYPLRTQPSRYFFG